MLRMKDSWILMLITVLILCPNSPAYERTHEATLPILGSGIKEIGGEGFAWSTDDGTFLLIGGYSGIFPWDSQEHELVFSSSIITVGNDGFLLFDIGYAYNLLDQGRLFFGIGLGGLVFEEEKLWGPSETKTDFFSYFTGGVRIPLTRQLAARIAYKARLKEGILHELRVGFSYFTEPWFF